MAQWLVLIGLLTKNYDLSLPMVLTSIPIYFYLIILCWQFFSKPDQIQTITFDTKVLFWIFIILIDQLVMVGFSYVHTDRPNLTRGILTGSLNIILFIGTIFLVYYLMNLMINNQLMALKFVQGTIKTFLGFFALVLLPQVIATVSPILNSWVNLVGRLFEARYVGRDDFYWAGSYVTTQHRINGFSSEASYLAVMLAVIFIPLFLTAIRYKFSFFKNKVNPKSTKYYWLLLMATFFVLFFAKTTTGFVVILLSSLILLIRLDNKRRNRLLVVILLLICLIVLLYINVPYIRTLLNQYLLKKKGTSNRLGGTIGLLMTFLHFPISGVGDGFTGFYNLKYVPTNTIHNWEFRNVYIQSGYPVLSVWGGWLASFGLIGVTPVIIFIVNKCKKARLIYQKLILINSKNSMFYRTLIESFFYFLFMVVVLSLFMFSWTNIIYLVMLFFYIRIIKLSSEELVY